MHFVITALLIFALLFGPQFWARRTFKRYSSEQDHFPGTGGELARHLLDRFNMTEVKVETTERGDHYDPESKTVRLSSQNFSGKSLTAIAVACHEVGHAIQDKEGHGLLRLRTRLVKLALTAERIGSVTIFLAPVLTGIFKTPSIGMLMFLAGITSIFISTIVHLVTLPVEWDASFGKAMPILEEGYVNEQERKAARKVLKAAALTYVAGSLAGLLNLWRWIRVLRPR